MIDNDHVRIIDPSTAHRTEPGWAYGFPELSPEHRSAVEKGNRVAVPGCHASGFIALVYPWWPMGAFPQCAGEQLFPDGLQRRRQKDDCRL